MWNKVIYNLTYYSIYCWLYLHALLPFRALYILSDILYYPLYYVIRYRRKVVRKNLENSFPDYSTKELRKIEKDFYQHFCDYIVETIKLLHISDKEAQQRIVINNTDLIKDQIKEGNSCLLLLGHYGNWEWVPTITSQFDGDVKIGQIYKPLKNRAVDHLFLKIRSRFGSFGIAKGDTFRSILNLKKQNNKVLIGIMADQTPTRNSIHYWTNFLNQDTAVFTGVERIAKKTDYAVAYLDVQKVSRGKYVCECKLISDNPASEPDFAITEKYIREFEKTILRNPAYWLWSHKRWKYKKSDFEKK